MSLGTNVVVNSVALSLFPVGRIRLSHEPGAVRLMIGPGHSGHQLRRWSDREIRTEALAIGTTIKRVRALWIFLVKSLEALQQDEKTERC